jgi:hypothetical protein
MNVSIILSFALVALIPLACLSIFFGKNLPKVIWWISIVSAGLAGFAFAAILAPFPESLVLGAFVAVVTILLIIALRLSGRNQPG